MKFTLGKSLASVLILAVLFFTVSTLVDFLLNRNIVKIPRVKLSQSGGIDLVLYKLIEGRDYDSSQIKVTCDYLDGRYDCSDFKMPSILHILYRYQDQLYPGDYERLKRALLDYKYWITDPGEDSMCYWSENHQILFAAAEYLAGSLFPGEIFTNTGLMGYEHAERGRKRVLLWLKQRWDYGFTEWYSNTYYKEDMGPLAVLIDFAPHEEVSIKASIIMDLLLYDMASQSYKGYFVSTMGRGYETKKMSGDYASVKEEMDYFFGFNTAGEKTDSANMGVNLIFSQKYTLPPVLKEIARDREPAIIKASQGLNLTELAERGLVGQEDEQIMMQWAMESFTNPQTIRNSLTYVEQHNLFSNSDLHGFKDIRFSLLKLPGLLPLISRAVNLQTNGLAIQRADTYTYKTPFYSLYTAQSYHPGTYGDQHHIAGMTLAGDLSLFHNHPALEEGKDGVHGNSPGYWVGYGHLPHSVQFENVNLSLYIIPASKGLMEAELLDYTHAYFPSALFDESSLEGGLAFGRRGDTFVALITPGELSYRYHEKDHTPGGKEYDLILPGKQVYWITEASDRISEGSYDNFKNRIREQAESIAYDGQTLSYLRNDQRMRLTYKGDFTINGTIQKHSYARYDSPYVFSDREPDEVSLQWKGRSLYLNFDKQLREIGG